MSIVVAILIVPILVFRSFKVAVLLILAAMLVPLLLKAIKTGVDLNPRHCRRK